MACGNRLQILIETRLGSGGVFLGASELRDGQVGEPILQIAEVLARRGGGADNGDQPRLFGKALRVAHQFSYQQRGRHGEDRKQQDREEDQPCADRYMRHRACPKFPFAPAATRQQARSPSTLWATGYAPTTTQTTTRP